MACLKCGGTRFSNSVRAYPTYEIDENGGNEKIVDPGWDDAPDEPFQCANRDCNWQTTYDDRDPYSVPLGVSPECFALIRKVKELPQGEDRDEALADLLAFLEDADQRDLRYEDAALEEAGVVSYEKYRAQGILEERVSTYTGGE